MEMSKYWQTLESACPFIIGNELSCRHVIHHCHHFDDLRFRYSSLVSFQVQQSINKPHLTSSSEVDDADVEFQQWQVRCLNANW
jgi:hypothetical protein